jgi:multidrug resistance protein MdtO
MTDVSYLLASIRRPGWIAWLRRELAPFPGRGIGTCRVTVAVVLTAIISMTLQVPQLGFSTFFVFFVSKENRVITMITGVILIVGVTVAEVITLILYRVTFDYPELRIPVMAASIFIGMFLSRVFVLGPLGFGIGFYIALMQTIAEAAPNTDALVRSSLWLWMAIVYPIILTVVLNQVFLPVHPWNVLVRRLANRLAITESVLKRMLRDGLVGGQIQPSLTEVALVGTAGLSALLNQAESKDPKLQVRHASLTAMIAASEHLLEASGALAFREPVALSPGDRVCAEALLRELHELQEVFCDPILPPNPCERPIPELSQLRELQLAVESFHDGLVKASPVDIAPPAQPVKKRLFVADAFTNPAYGRFALKVTFAAMLCYVVYTGLDWPGITTSFVTCCFIALENTGASMRKGWLRLCGCLFGGLMGFLSIVYLIPRMESITSLVMLTAIGSVVMGWIAMGGERIAYAGLQGAFAFYLCLFQGFEPEINFTTIRDRIVGIILGICVTSIIFHFLWPEHAIDRLRVTMAKTLRNLSQIFLLPKTEEPVAAEGEDIGRKLVDLKHGLEDTLRLSELSIFEKSRWAVSCGLSRADVDHMVADTEALGLMTTVLFARTKLGEWERLDKPLQQAEMTLRFNASQQLAGVAEFVEKGRLRPLPDLSAEFSAWNEVVPPVATNDRIRLIRRVMERVTMLLKHTQKQQISKIS